MRAPLRMALVVACVLLAWLPARAGAQARAWLDRDRIALDETTTLNIESGDESVASPDYAPLRRDFEVTGNTSSRQYSMVNGVGTARVIFAVALRPLRDGVIPIPSLRVGNARSQPLVLTVTANAAATPARAGAPVFIEAEADAQTPYVQQSVGYVVRLYSATSLVSGQLDQDAPAGATLQRIGEDAQYQRDIGGRRYAVVERRFLLIPERSGDLAIPGARFRGQGLGGFFDEMFGDGRRDLSAGGPPRILRVLPAPPDAPQPWLPLTGLRLRYLETPQVLRAGEAASVVVEMTADGAVAAQLPELALAMPGGAQVFAEAAQPQESFEQGRPWVRVTRKFSIVPARAGALRIPGLHLPWWDVRAGLARSASLPDLNLQVAAGANGYGAQPAGTADATPDAASATARQRWKLPGLGGIATSWWWMGAAVLLAGALLWRVRGNARARRIVPGAPLRSAAVDAGDAGAADPASRAPSLQQALQHGDLAAIADALRTASDPPALSLDDVRVRLDDAAQVAAIDAMQEARWGDGDAAAALARLRDAFRRGPRWRVVARGKATPVLPPLYPEA